ncbi:hypothetical protein EYF80_019795 [Liparis tanakae]|uniref:Uncharacterized protein n=1 Tax=Liparis tanakae TaxID=230148 RepID=A0A4Z2HYB4_9TELE|nr:hypothetical protein EYF80_019795 [Liparis tanakae]
MWSHDEVGTGGVIPRELVCSHCPSFSRRHGNALTHRQDTSNTGMETPTETGQSRPDGVGGVQHGLDIKDVVCRLELMITDSSNDLLQSSEGDVSSC